MVVESEGVVGAVVILYRHSLMSLGDKIKSLAFPLHSALLVDTTYVVRTMMQRLDIVASYHGNGMLQILRCTSRTVGDNEVFVKWVTAEFVVVVTMMN